MFIKNKYNNKVITAINERKGSSCYYFSLY